MEISIGDKFGTWEVLEITDRYTREKILCKCDCGLQAWKRSDCLLSGKSITCRKCYHYKKQNEWIFTFRYITNSMFGSIKCNAKVRNLPFEVSKDYLDDLLEKQSFKCAISGVQLKYPVITREKNKRIDYNKTDNTLSLDRIDNSKGYIEGNVQWVHKIINIMKGVLSDTDFITMCKIVAEYNSSVKMEELEEIVNTYRHGIRKVLN